MHWHSAWHSSYSGQGPDGALWECERLLHWEPLRHNILLRINNLVSSANMWLLVFREYLRTLPTTSKWKCWAKAIYWHDPNYQMCSSFIFLNAVHYVSNQTTLNSEEKSICNIVTPSPCHPCCGDEVACAAHGTDVFIGSQSLLSWVGDNGPHVSGLSPQCSVLYPDLDASYPPEYQGPLAASHWFSVSDAEPWLVQLAW